MSKKGKLPLGKVYLTDRAISDLLNVELYSIETWGKAVAKRYLLKFEKAFRLIELNPDLLRPNPRLHESLLFYRIEKHLLACIRLHDSWSRRFFVSQGRSHFSSLARGRVEY